MNSAVVSPHAVAVLPYRKGAEQEQLKVAE